MNRGPGTKWIGKGNMIRTKQSRIIEDKGQLLTVGRKGMALPKRRAGKEAGISAADG